MNKYKQSDELQKYINWDELLTLPRYAGGHDLQMKNLFKNSEVIAHWNEGDYQGQVATCVRLTNGKFKNCYIIYNDYYGSCSGCDAWEDASDEDVKSMCIGLSNSAYIFKNIEDVKEFLINPNDDCKLWSSWNNMNNILYDHIENNIID